ncbi:MAG: adenylosuccinate synthetase [Puniceicoccales bacterium]|jgi:adenylosuccinate synthase|nr:adenylosuccinate synthetase [Puniceicoccales bacterium]
MALTSFTSQLIADTGISMGDEGKGRLIPEVIRELQALHNRRDIVGTVLKVNGGANSGHTVGGLKLNLLPGGVVERDVATLALGAGVVADPRKAHWEARPLEKLGYSVYPRLLIDERTLVSDVTHRMLDLAWEDYRVNILGQLPRGSTGRGITPAYADEVSQWQIYFADFCAGKDEFAAKLSARMDRAERTIEHVCRLAPEKWEAFLIKLTEAEVRANQSSIEAGIFPRAEFDFTRFGSGSPFRFDHAAVTDAYWEAGGALRERIGDVREHILRNLANGQYLIGEFGQAYWLDKRHGFAPNVTASHTFTPELFQSAGIPVQAVHTIGVCKAYDTKVGTHTFLTQMDDAHPLTVHLKKLEYGTSTGRQRMVGWCDCVEKADALRHGGYQDIVINKLDALSPSGEWKGGTLLVCTGYRDASGQIIESVPRNDAVRRSLKPVYAELPGWHEDISVVRHFADLPANARRYIAFVLQTIVALASRHGAKTPLPNLRYIGIGPDPEQIIKDVPETGELIKLA